MGFGTIQEFLPRCKAWLEQGIGEWGLLAIVFLVAFASFGLGRLSALEDVRPTVAIEETPESAALPTIPVGGYVVASATGGVYYFPWCTGAQKIPEGSQLWFSSETAAQKAGYNPAKNCKGL